MASVDTAVNVDASERADMLERTLETEGAGDGWRMDKRRRWRKDAREDAGRLLKLPQLPCLVNLILLDVNPARCWSRANDD